MAYSKGQIITMNLDGTDREYRILTINGNIAEVVAMFDPDTRCTFNSNNVNTYDGGDLDTYLNTTWYGGLTTAAKNAIVSKTLTQYQYSYDFYAYKETTHASYAKYSTKSVKASGLVRKVYALDIEDIENYFNHTFSEADILELFWNVRTKPDGSKEVWTRSAISGKSNMAWYVGTYGYMSDGRVTNNNAVRPAFTIDLSKILTPGYSITYHANDGIPTPQNLTNQTELPTLPIVSKTNYNFVGWYYDSTFTQEAHAGDTLSANVDLYAKFIRSHITLDLTTLSGWGNVADGQHSIQVVAKADGYKDSEKSTAVSFTKGVTGHTLTITNSSSSADVLQVYASTSGSWGGDLLATIAKGSTSEVNIPTNYVYFACPTAKEVFFTLSNVNPSNALVMDSGGMDYIACKINQNGSCTITIG